MGRKKFSNTVRIDAFEHLKTSDGELFADERFIDRKQALDMFFKSKSGFENVEPSAEMLIPIGDTFYAALNPRSSFIAPQIREAYERERIVRIGRNMRDGEDGQLQNIGVAFIEPKSLDQYLADMNFYFGSTIKRDEVYLHPKFHKYIITVYGHNRQLGAASANLETTGNPDAGITIFAKVLQNPPFWRVLENQAVENSGEPPFIWQRARSIVMYKALRERDGIPLSQKDVARKFNVDPDQIWRAERYEALPLGIQELVMAEKIPYSAAIELDALRELYGEEYMVDLAYRLSAQYPPSRKKVLDEVRKRLAASKLTPEVLALIETDKLTLPQAEELARLVGIVDSEEMNTLSVWICLKKPSIEEIRKKVRSLLEEELNGHHGLFSSALLSTEEAAWYLESSRRAAIVRGIQDSVRQVHDHVSGLGTLLDIGMLGPLVDGNPFTTAAAETSVDHLIRRLSERITLDENVDIRHIGVLLKKAQLSTTEPELIDAIDKLIAEISAVMVAEVAETQSMQAQRRQELAGKIFKATSAVGPVQEGLF